jgi:hypothetical protein
MAHSKRVAITAHKGATFVQYIPLTKIKFKVKNKKKQ